MMYHQLLFDLVLLAILKTTAAGRNDGFCRLGCGSIDNIGCNTDWNSTNCSPSPAPTIFPLSSTNIFGILSQHNTLRNILAGGQVIGLNPAANMMELTWDEDLQTLAEANVKYCNISYDYCHKTDRNSVSGQNIFSAQATDNFIDTNAVKQDAINLWYSQSQNASQASLDNFTGYNQGNIIGHFAQLVNDVTDTVGCGVAQYMTYNLYTTLITCNYGSINLYGQPTYKSTTGQGGSNCKEKSDHYTYLCKKLKPAHGGHGDK